jgi:hypothetical protein
MASGELTAVVIATATPTTSRIELTLQRRLARFLLWALHNAYAYYILNVPLAHVPF